MPIKTKVSKSIDFITTLGIVTVSSFSSSSPWPQHFLANRMVVEIHGIDKLLGVKEKQLKLDI